MEARILLEGALDLALTNDLHAAAVRAFNNLAVNHESRDRYRDAADTSNPGIELARHVGDRVWEEIFLLRADQLARADRGMGRGFGARCGRGKAHRWSRSMHSSSSSRTLTAGAAMSPPREAGSTPCRPHRTPDDPQVHMGYASAEAHVLRAEGRFDEALAVAESGIAFKDEVGTTFLKVKLCYVEALESAFALGDRTKVEALLNETESLRFGARPPLLEAHAQRFRSKLSGDDIGYRAAAALFREHELVLDLGWTLLEHGEATVQRGAARRGAGDLRAAGRNAPGSSAPLGRRSETKSSHDLRELRDRNKPAASSAASAGRRCCAAPRAAPRTSRATKFCGECGSALRRPAPVPRRPPAAAPAAERRLVSVLFADLVGFTRCRRRATPRTCASFSPATSTPAGA